MNRILRTVTFCALLLCLATVAFADLKVKQKTTIGGHTYESTVMIKGQRQRNESAFGGGAPAQVSILQCDLRRTLLINDATRRYLVSSLDGGGAADGATTSVAPAPAPSEPARRGGTVTHMTTITDTGERRQMFGLTARHLKTKLTVEPSPDACDQTPFRQETDGWYTDFEYGLNCPVEVFARPPRTNAQGGGCQDRIVSRQAGAGKLGFPLSVTTTTYGADGQVTSTLSVEVEELSRAALDPVLFDVPAGYTLAQSTQELYGFSAGGVPGATPGGQEDAGRNETAAATPAATPASSKRPGAIRIGVAQLKDLTDKNLTPEALRARLITALTGQGLEAVALNAYTPAALDAEAKQKECDFVLTTDIVALKHSAAGKIGGLFGRATGVPTGADRTEAQLNFKLTPVGGTPRLQATANAKEAGDDTSLNAALDKEAQAVAKEAKKKQ